MDVDVLAAELGLGVRAALGDDLLGLYLVDSSAPDFVAVTADRLTSGQQAALEGLHARLPGLLGPVTQQLAGSYAPAADLRSPMTVGRSWPHVERGSHELAASAHDNTLAARWVLRERGTVVVGPPAATFVAEVDAGALRAEMIGLTRTRAEELEEHPEQLADPAFRVQLVTTLCRALFTASKGQVTGAATAAEWALRATPAEHHDLIRWALTGVSAGPALAASTRAFAWEVHRLVGTEALGRREA